MHRFNPWRHTSWGLVLAALFAGPAWARADGTTPNCYLVSVGVDDYAKVNKLKGCVTDARDVAAQFVAQQGKRFDKVTSQILVDQQATKAAVVQSLDWLSRAGRAGDFAVLMLSGHGGRTQTGGWYFLPYDFDSSRHNATALTDREILTRARVLADRGLKVLIIIDACFAGQLRLSAADTLLHCRNPQGGGVVLMLSSMPGQTSAALGHYSAFARAVVEGLAGAADLDGDGRVTVRELRLFAYQRTYRLLTERGMQAQQDGECVWSLSIRGDLQLVAVRQQGGTEAGVTVWAGTEDLAGYGRLAFRFIPGGRAVMTDARGSTEGIWQQSGSAVTLTFQAGRVVYRGTINCQVMSGTAGNGRREWMWTVQFQAPTR